MSGCNSRRAAPYGCSPSLRPGPLHDAVTAPALPPERSPGDHRVVTRVFALTDVGRSREHNEDTFVVADLESGTAFDFANGSQEITAGPHGLLFVVADGMGGAASGELASSMAGAVVVQALRDTWQTIGEPSPEAFVTALRDATVLANTRIHQHARENPQHRGMGTTVTIAGFLGDRLYVVQVGDSRAYMIRDGDAQLLTKDQSLMQRLVDAGEITAEEAEVSERRNIILQALGPEAQITVDLTHQQVRRGDTLLLCSDGLSGLVRASEIARTTHNQDDIQEICTRLVTRANQLGGPDNITVVVARFEGTALQAREDGDAFGYNALPLAGTMNDVSRDMPSSARDARPTLTADAKAANRTAAPSRALLPDDPDGALFSDDRALIGAPEPVVEARRRAVQPVFLLLALLAACAIAWVAFSVLT